MSKNCMMTGMASQASLCRARAADALPGCPSPWAAMRLRTTARLAAAAHTVRVCLSCSGEVVVRAACFYGGAARQGARLEYLVTSLLPSNTGVVPTACFTTQLLFRMLGINLKRLLRFLSAAGPSPSRNLRTANVHA